MTTLPPSDDATRDSFGPALGPGTRISNRYAIQELLGIGAFGRVYRATDEMLGRTVAVKTLIIDKRERSDGKDAVSSFLEEARTIAKLDHPHIVPVHDAGNEDGIPWMAMRLVDGESLDATLKRREWDRWMDSTCGARPVRFSTGRVARFCRSRIRRSRIGAICCSTLTNAACEYSATGGETSFA